MRERISCRIGFLEVGKEDNLNSPLKLKDELNKAVVKLLDILIFDK